MPEGTEEVLFFKINSIFRPFPETFGYTIIFEKREVKIPLNSLSFPSLTNWFALDVIYTKALLLLLSTYIYERNKMITPELYCSDIKKTSDFYTSTLQMNIKYEREEDGFICLEKDGASVMIEELTGNGRRWITGKMDKPFGRGINLEWKIDNVEDLYAHVLLKSKDSVYLPIESKEYRVDNKSILQKQFIVQDPDGYLIRLCE